MLSGYIDPSPGPRPGADAGTETGFTGCAVSTTEEKTTTNSLSSYLTSRIKVDLLIEIHLLVLTLSTGIQDAISFPDFACFASNQTGNTVLLAVGLAGYNGGFFHFDIIGISLALFVAGAALTGHIGHAVGSRRRVWLLWTNIVQTAMVFGAAAIQFSHGVQETGSWAQAAIALLAFASGAQVGASRAMQIPEITTAMATAAWVDLVIDANILVLKNRPRNRRVFFLAFLVAGSFMGAFMRLRIGSAWALVVSALGKLLATLMLLFSRADERG
ncbi:hypothetical protein HRR83_001501 [Exophiala dermatitidis]|uniref:DUF1275 domain-containing protein n=2 Tax=Exophiala dermatitidis TaxID=5970 RepID=H6C683_EXODN|nr:uncharacterized protein HMPREF1120_07224 [Exophiala dermatitidis NIH/UT8656]KAJ4522988.1 hypothetical protein HRR75_001384 [Exophiala dermatitidis]EHY59229.1 hypothetical protein HMPREF1120_07224 [Exophiala dermatitidis NIH/UT8656]KAJ4526310.1 hypothetical protein HRR74_001505 [Exophiala dermatitidis]KAJ4526747.1 hypothetical protein HRR73_001542 [Exophiala dermatitidis]KAJ4532453.1 hypothetical protein HRR76_007445 [Exophiala dermatitidis]